MGFFDIFPTFQEAPIAWALLCLIVPISITAFYSRSAFQALLLHPYEVSLGRRWYTLFTAAFVHTGWWHLTYNVFLVFGFSYDLYGIVKQEVGSNWTFWCSLLLTLLFISIPYLVITFLNRNKLSYTTVGSSGLSYALIGFCTIFYPLETLRESWWNPLTQAYQVWLLILILLNLFLFRKSKTNHVIHLCAFLLGTLSAFLLRPESFRQLLNSLFDI